MWLFCLGLPDKVSTLLTIDHCFLEVVFGCFVLTVAFLFRNIVNIMWITSLAPARISGLFSEPAWWVVSHPYPETQ